MAVPVSRSGMGHEDAFPLLRLSVGFGFIKKTFAGTGGTEQDAPIPDSPVRSRHSLATFAQSSFSALVVALYRRYEKFESLSLHRRVCKPSVPRRFHSLDVKVPRSPGHPAHREDVYFRTVDFFRGADFFREAPFRVGGLRTSLTALPAWNRTALLAAISMVSPVRGFRASRAGRAAALKMPRPETSTASPARRPTRMALTTAFTAWLPPLG